MPNEPANEKTTEKKTATQVVIERFLKDVDEVGTMPWQRPYERYNAFNYFTKRPYRGFNRLVLPFGEYITRNQINTYNKEHKEDFRFQKGIEWYPIVYFKPDVREITYDEVKKAFPDAPKFSVGDTRAFIGIAAGQGGMWQYGWDGKSYIKQRNILRYYDVADRKWFKNSKGELLPSRIETGEVVIELQDAKVVFDSYIERSGVKLWTENYGTPYYDVNADMVALNPKVRSSEAYYATGFHEAAHSTGHFLRLNRPELMSSSGKESEKYAIEECIAEITACLCCAETGIHDFQTSGSMEYSNNIAYVQSWKKHIYNWGSKFFYIVSQADKAFNYICNDADGFSEAEDSDVNV